MVEFLCSLIYTRAFNPFNINGPVIPLRIIYHLLSNQNRHPQLLSCSYAYMMILPLFYIKCHLDFKICFICRFTFTKYLVRRFLKFYLDLLLQN